MDYNEALGYIHGTQKFGIKLGLHNMRCLLGLMGDPHKKSRYVHVAGTNGKGSTVAFIGSMLIHAGYKAGIYTSPFLERFTERIRINDEEISRNDLARLTSLVKEKVGIMISRGENHPTEFEIVTAIAFQYFYENNCDVVVLEVGLGGRFDSTNVIDAPLVSVITTINYDHMDILGDTLEKIAFEKAGIIKTGGNVVAYPHPENIENIFTGICREKSAAFHRVDFSGLKLIESNLEGQIFNFEKYKSLKISLLGSYQVNNAAVAIKTIEILNKHGFDIDEAAIRDGLIETKWPGRFEVLKKNPVFIIDGAHNTEGTKMLVHELITYFPSKKITFIIGVLKDKEYKLMIEAAAGVSERFITVTPESARALSAENLAILLKSYCKDIIVSDTIKNAAETACRITSAEDIVCAFGSLYYIGQIRSYLK